MAKKKDQKKDDRPDKMSRKDYEKELVKLQVGVEREGILHRKEEPAIS